MFTGEVIVKFLLCCITDNGLSDCKTVFAELTSGDVSAPPLLVVGVLGLILNVLIFWNRSD